MNAMEVADLAKVFFFFPLLQPGMACHRLFFSVSVALLLFLETLKRRQSKRHTCVCATANSSNTVIDFPGRVP